MTDYKLGDLVSAYVPTRSRVSREEGVEVAVVEIDPEGTENGPVRRPEAVRGVSEGEGRGASVRDAERGEEG